MGKIYDALIIDGSGNGGGGIPEAPTGGKQYLRGSGAWQALAPVLAELAELSPPVPTDDELHLTGFRGPDMAVLTTLSEFGQGLIAQPGEFEARNWIDAQEANGNLSALAAVTAAVDKLPYFTAANAMALATITAAARTLLTCADAAAMRQALEVPDMIAGQEVFGVSSNGIFHPYPDADSTLGSYEFSFTARGDLRDRVFSITAFELVETWYSTFTPTRLGEPVYDAESDLTTIRVLLRRHDPTMDHAGWGSGYVGIDWIAIKPAAGLARVTDKTITVE